MDTRPLPIIARCRKFRVDLSATRGKSARDRGGTVMKRRGLLPATSCGRNGPTGRAGRRFDTSVSWPRELDQSLRLLEISGPRIGREEFDVCLDARQLPFAARY